MLTELEKKIVKELQKGLPLVNRPFLDMADQLGLTEEVLLIKIKDMMKRGIIRRFSAAVRHREIGYTANAMVVWKIPESGIEKAGKIFATFEEVSHCYQRENSGGWEYNLFTMVHGRNEDECLAVALTMSKTSGIEDYLVLFSSQELKKESMKYFLEDRLKN